MMTHRDTWWRTVMDVVTSMMCRARRIIPDTTTLTVTRPFPSLDPMTAPFIGIDRTSELLTVRTITRPGGFIGSPWRAIDPLGDVIAVTGRMSRPSSGRTTMCIVTAGPTERIPSG